MLVNCHSSNVMVSYAVPLIQPYDLADNKRCNYCCRRVLADVWRIVSVRVSPEQLPNQPARTVKRRQRRPNRRRNRPPAQHPCSKHQETGKKRRRPRRKARLPEHQSYVWVTSKHLTTCPLHVSAKAEETDDSDSEKEEKSKKKKGKGKKKKVSQMS